VFGLEVLGNSLVRAILEEQEVRRLLLRYRADKVVIDATSEMSNNDTVDLVS
jgi:hypothetical protein